MSPLFSFFFSSPPSSRRGSADTWSVIIAAIIAIVVLLVIVAIFVLNTSKAKDDLNSCESKGGKCLTAEICENNNGLVSKSFSCGDSSKEICCYSFSVTEDNEKKEEAKSASG